MYMIKFTNHNGSSGYRYFTRQDTAIRWQQAHNYRMKSWTLSKAEEDDEYWFTRFVPLLQSS